MTCSISPAIPIRRATCRTLLAAALLAAGTAAWGQGATSTPIRIVVPYPAGGGADIVTRRIAERAKDILGQPIVVENKAGAATAIGALAVQNAPPDGHTLLLATSTTLAVNPNLQRSLTYAPDKLVPVAALQAVPFMLSVNPLTPISSLRELPAYARAHPGMVNYGTLGVGSSNHMLGGLLEKRAPGLVPIHYQSSGQAMLALARGDIHLYFDGISTSVARVNGGELRGLAVTSHKRVPAVPGIPTVEEAGFPELGLSIWYGLVAPAGTPDAVIRRLNGAFNQVLAQPEVIAFMTADGTEPMAMTPTAFGTLIREDRASWKRTIDALQIRLE
ncbi:Argininosuccinate lyase [Variovorax sp. PBL-H6]|uniref:Bug family tripartite tricarboxylate transporter substrate binding protein n=1 Tax=Variovorax sp. PBL-H6 TaxID=434009 RepID=UPI00131815CE|nr:tripartite tricarboxylate transporter substrate binding protein [Variovorax sp. PBL-H6]VTU38466.1 Argininosuccinate lyase [Variovorax sp. PBL-H6]